MKAYYFVIRNKYFNKNVFRKEVSPKECGTGDCVLFYTKNA